jgi:hypothetical protein
MGSRFSGRGWLASSGTLQFLSFRAATEKRPAFIQCSSGSVLLTTCSLVSRRWSRQGLLKEPCAIQKAYTKQKWSECSEPGPATTQDHSKHQRLAPGTSMVAADKAFQVADASDQQTEQSHEIQNKETNSSRHISKQHFAPAARAVPTKMLLVRNGTNHPVAARHHSPFSAWRGAAAEGDRPCPAPSPGALGLTRPDSVRRRRRFRQHCGRPPQCGIVGQQLRKGEEPAAAKGELPAAHGPRNRSAIAGTAATDTAGAAPAAAAKRITTLHQHPWID